MATFASKPAAIEIPESSLAYPGWRVVLAAHLGAMMGFGSLLVFTFGVFLKPLTVEFGWSREAVSRAFAVAAMTVAICSPFLGQALDRFAPRRIVLPCIAVFGLAFASLGLLTANLWHLYATFVVIGIVGNATTQMGFSGAVSSWFTRRRGIALALVMAGSGLGSFLLPMLAQYLIGTAGWRTAYHALGALVLVIALPLAALFLRRRPLDPATARSSDSESFRAALRTRAFWILVATLFLTSVAANGAITHLAALLTDRGISPANAAFAAASLGGASFLGRLLTGFLLDRYFGPKVSCILLLTMAAGILLLSQAATLFTGFLAAVLIGFGLGGEADVTPYLLSRYFGLASFSTLYGLTWTFYAVAGALGPVILGRVFDLTGSYTGVLGILSIPTAVSALLMLWMPRYRLP